MNLKIELLEATLLFVLTFTILRVFEVYNVLLLLVLAAAILAFTLYSFFLKMKYAQFIRILAFFSVVVLLHGFLLFDNVSLRHRDIRYLVHDGSIITEQSFFALIGGINPYEINFDEFYKVQDNYLQKVQNNEVDKNMYSPVAFFINFPVFWAQQLILGYIDMRVSAVTAFAVCGFLAAFLVREKLLFSILFFFNPIFVKSLYFGTNDVFLLLFLFITLVFLNLKKFYWATFAIALASATKLLILPFIPLYFLYLFFVNKKQKGEVVLKHLPLYILTNIVIYGPFILWNPEAFWKDFVEYNLLSDSQSRPIAGFLGILQIFHNFQIEINSMFLLLLFLPLSILLCIFSAKILLKNLNLSTLCFLYFVFFLISLCFSRVVQSDYLTFISQVLLLSAFI